MLAQTIASYIEKNMNSQRNVQCVMLVGINRMMTMRKIHVTIRGIQQSKERKISSLVVTPCVMESIISFIKILTKN
jgi:hypothetical protein